MDVMQTSDKAYWERFYARGGASSLPSDFAKYVADTDEGFMGHLFDVGCGNARDTFFFADQDIAVTGIDQCGRAITRNRVRGEVFGFGADFVEDDLTRFNYDLHAHFLEQESYSIYARWVLHTLDPFAEERFFGLLGKSLDLKYLFLECRTINDALYGEGEKVGHHAFVTDHYRRFINPVDLRTRLEAGLARHFEVLLYEESKKFDLAVEEKPTLLRVVLRVM